MSFIGLSMRFERVFHRCFEYFYSLHLESMRLFTIINDSLDAAHTKPVNGAGLAHIAFEVDDVAAVLQRLLDEDGSRLGGVVTAQYPCGLTATFVYARDIEGHIMSRRAGR